MTALRHPAMRPQLGGGRGGLARGMHGGEARASSKGSNVRIGVGSNRSGFETRDEEGRKHPSSRATLLCEKLGACRAPRHDSRPRSSGDDDGDVAEARAEPEDPAEHLLQLDAAVPALERREDRPFEPKVCSAQKKMIETASEKNGDVLGLPTDHRKISVRLQKNRGIPLNEPSGSYRRT